MFEIAKPKIKVGDWHLVVSDWETHFESIVKYFDHTGRLINSRPCLAKGQQPNYRGVGGDTPPGLYKIGEMTVTAQVEKRTVWNAYGKYFFDLVGLQQNEERYGRAGCGIHGGGTGALDPLASYQELKPTLGCIRFFNADLEKILLPIYRETQKVGATIYVSVHQF